MMGGDAGADDAGAGDAGAGDVAPTTADPGDALFKEMMGR
jgi:hypothetical protein